MREFQSERVPRHNLTDSSWLGLQELDIEIGAGRGLHAIRYAKENPDRSLLAIERTHAKFAGLLQRRLAHADVENLWILHADAISVFAHHVRDVSVARIFLLYPNPYPKASQANQRWQNMPFMSKLREKMKPGAQLTLATNIEAYAKDAAEKLISNWSFELVTFGPVPPDAVPRTHFEKKYLARGEKCWNLIVRKPTI